MISGIAGLVSFVIGIVVLIKLFQKGGVVQGIIGLVTCQIWTFIWGWRNAKAENLTTMMWIWTGVIVLSIIISVVAGGSAMPTGGGGDVVPTPEGAMHLIRLFM